MLEDEKDKEKQKKLREEKKLKKKPEQPHQVDIVGGQTLPPSDLVYQPQYFSSLNGQPQGLSYLIGQSQDFSYLNDQPDQYNLINVYDNEAQNLEVVKEVEVSMDNNSNIDQQNIESFQKVDPQDDYVDSQRSYHDLDTGKISYQ